MCVRFDHIRTNSGVRAKATVGLVARSTCLRTKAHCRTGDSFSGSGVS